MLKNESLKKTGPSEDQNFGFFAIPNVFPVIKSDA